MSVKFCPIASGSSGNSIYVGTEHTHILIDAGLSGKKIQEGLKALDVEGSSIDALFITHEHIDHIKGAGILSRRFDIPIYATPGTWDSMASAIGEVPRKNIQYVYNGENCFINDVCVRPFDIPHDAAEPVGYNIFANDIKLTLATDLGHITETIKENLADSHVLLLEANHDEEMLKNGPYPYSLKKRIAGENGHISNRTAGKLLAEIMSKTLQYVYLGHLSAENNIPKLAFQTVAGILAENHIKLGAGLRMEMAARHTVSSVVEL